MLDVGSDTVCNTTVGSNTFCSLAVGSNTDWNKTVGLDTVYNMTVGSDTVCNKAVVDVDDRALGSCDRLGRGAGDDGGSPDGCPALPEGAQEPDSRGLVDTNQIWKYFILFNKNGLTFFLYLLIVLYLLVVRKMPDGPRAE